MKNKNKKQNKESIKIDLGCGENKKEGFTGVDKYKFPGVDVVLDLGSGKWPWDDNSVDEINCSNLINHLTNLNNKHERVHFFNELYRVIKKDAKVSISFPHWCSMRHYGDPTHCEPFSELGFFYLNKEWRDKNAPHTDIKWNEQGYNCNFETTWGYSVRADLIEKEKEVIEEAIRKEKEAAQDVIANMIKLDS
jgi:SAM-dependent methyltransferase